MSVSDRAAHGDFETLDQRLVDEIAVSNAPVPWLATVSAWARVPL